MPSLAPSVSARMAGFLRVLRDNGFIAAMPEMMDALALLAGEEGGDAGNWRDPAALRRCWRALFCSCQRDWERFDELFNAYWRRAGMRRAARVSGLSGRPAPRRTLQDLGGQGGQWTEDSRDEGGGAIADNHHASHRGASRSDALDSLDLRHMHDPDELRRAHDLAERLAARMRHRLGRREREARRGRRLDLRKTVRRSIGFGGLPMRLAFRQRPPQPLRLVLIMDASGSMAPYCAFFLRFMRGVLNSFRHADAFVFHTRLIHISDAMAERNPEKALERMSLMTAGWAGGTRIGECLERFNDHYARRLVNGRAVVIILSDGYDTSPPAQLAAQLARLKKRARRLVWLNPMMGWQGYEPVAAGMAAALPYIDLLAPAHNLRSLAALEPYLEKL